MGFGQCWGQWVRGVGLGKISPWAGAGGYGEGGPGCGAVRRTERMGREAAGHCKGALMPRRTVVQWVWVWARSWDCGAGGGGKEALWLWVWGVGTWGCCPSLRLQRVGCWGGGDTSTGGGEGTLGPVAELF